jgi:hypothetical protein
VQDWVHIQFFPLNCAEGAINSGHGRGVAIVGPSESFAYQGDLFDCHVVESSYESTHHAFVNKVIVLILIRAGEVEIPDNQPCCLYQIL